MVQHLRIARPVTDLERAAHMYCEGLKLRVLSSFRNHAGFDGVMIGVPGADYHFEFTLCREHPITPMPTPEDLTVFYVESEPAWREACASVEAAGFRSVSAFNPYWEVRGRSYADFDGYRLVLQQASWERVAHSE